MSGLRWVRRHLLREMMRLAINESQVQQNWQETGV